MPKLHTFIVEGNYQFPFDMLRYDQCWPHTSQDSKGIHSGDPYIARRVILTGTKLPTVARWESFGWKVVND
jgi:hypothetical protein